MLLNLNVTHGEAGVSHHHHHQAKLSALRAADVIAAVLGTDLPEVAEGLN